MIKQHINIPQLRFPEFGGEWERKMLREIFEISAGGDIKKENVSQIKNEKFKYPIYANAEKDKGFFGYSDVYKIKENVVTVAGRGVNYGIAHARNQKFYPIVRLLVLKPKHSEDIYFFEYQINQLNLFKESTGVPQLTAPQISNYKIFYPAVAEQQKIASFFTAIDQKISQLKQKKTLLEQYKKGVMQKIFSQEIRFKDENGHELPRWEKMKMGDVLHEHKALNINNEYSEVFSVAKHKGVINQIEHLGRSFSAADISNYKVAFPKDIIYTKSPTSDFPYGIIKQSLLDRIGVVSPLYGVFKPITNALGFLLHNYFLSWINTYNYLNPLVQKGAKNTMNINNNDFLNGSHIPLPMNEFEQTKIANFLSSIDDKINHTQKQIEKAEIWKKGLLQQMFV